MNVQVFYSRALEQGSLVDGAMSVEKERKGVRGEVVAFSRCDLWTLDPLMFTCCRSLSSPSPR